MTRDDEFIGQLEGYLDEYEGLTALPDSVRAAIRAQLPTSKQVGPPGWLLGRLPIMNSNVVRFGIAVAAVALLAIAALSYLPEKVGTPDATATPTPTRLPTLAPTALRDGPLQAGTYVAHPFLSPNDSLTFTFNVPDGWVGRLPGSIAPTEGAGGPDGAGVDFRQVRPGYRSPCSASEDVSPNGRTAAQQVDDLAGWLVDRYGSSYDISAPVDVTLSGYSGKRMDLLTPSDVDISSCQAYPFGDGAPYGRGPGNRSHLWILAVAWERVVIVAHDFAGTSPKLQAELLAIVDSIRIEPPSTRGWPGSYSNPPGKYSWGSADNWDVGCQWCMHTALLGPDSNVIAGTTVTITFAYSGDADEDGPTAVTIGGYPGTYEVLIKPYGARTRRWIADIEGTRVTITMTAEPGTTTAQLAEVDAIIESIRYEPTETGAFRLTFTLPGGWDSG